MQDDFQPQLENSRLKKLDYILNFELSSTVLFAISFIYSIMLSIMTIVAILFAPYLIYVLVKEHKYGWLAFFIIFVLLPYPILYLILPTDHFSFLIRFILLALFYFYCMLLKAETREWVTAENARNDLNTQRRLKSIKDKIFFRRK